MNIYIYTFVGVYVYREREREYAGLYIGIDYVGSGSTGVVDH